MHTFVRNLITEWRRLDLAVEGDTIVVAVSGGADSMALMLAVHDLVARKKIRSRVVVVHFNHKLRGQDSDADEAFVRDQARHLGFECVSEGGSIPKRGNLEQNARDSRYRFLLETARQARAKLVLTAHTQNDQAETFLMNLIRGSGAEGLSAMQPVRPLDKSIDLVRPLLKWATRNDTEEFCAHAGVEFRTDRMNNDVGLTRVRVRKVILPALAELNPRIVETLARTAGIISATPKAASQDPGNSLRVSDLKDLSTPELHETLRSWLRLKRGDLRGLQLKHIEAVERLILSRRSGNTVELPGGGRVIKHGGGLTFANIKVEK